ncbi:hypothetical protein BH18GEM1_BH18GEM1_13410 [soil metagenome]
MLKRIVFIAIASLLPAACDSEGPITPDEFAPGAVFTMTNAAARNEVVSFARGSDGSLTEMGRFDTGGRGSGEPRLGSQGPMTLSADNQWLLVANVGSDDISVFRVSSGGGLALVDVQNSGGDAPYSITIHQDLVFVLNNGGPGNVTGFNLAPTGQLAPVEGATAPLSQSGGTNPGQVLFSPNGRAVVVTEKATNRLTTYRVDGDGLLTGPLVHESSGLTPFGGAFTRSGTYLVTEAHEGAPGLAATSSYALTGDANLEGISGTVQSGETDVCWTLITQDDDFAFVTNFGSGTISSYRIAGDGSIQVQEPIAARTSSGQGPRDHGLTSDGQLLYVIEIGFEDSPSLPDGPTGIFGYEVQADGGLVEIGVFAEGRLPDTIAGLAAF